MAMKFLVENLLWECLYLYFSEKKLKWVNKDFNYFLVPIFYVSYTGIYMCVCIYIYMYTYIYIYIHTHTYICLYMRRRKLSQENN